MKVKRLEKLYKQSQWDKLLVDRGTNSPNARSNKIFTTKSQIELNCDPIKKPVRTKFTT